MAGDGIQIDNGDFVRVHNTILELLAKAPLRGQQFRCLMFLFRKTYGFNKKEDKISLAEWEAGTGMKRQNVWRELQMLIKCNVIVMKSSGPKRANTWGFNKYYEQWNFQSVITDDDSLMLSTDDRNEKSVIADDDSSVILDDYSSEPSVITDDDKSVITPHEHTKDNKNKQLAANDSDEAIALVREAYQAVCRIGPPMRSQEGRANLVAATAMIDRFSFAACLRGIATLKERYNATVTRNRHGISAPVAYLRSIMEGQMGTLVPVSVPANLDFALEDVTL